MSEQRTAPVEDDFDLGDIEDDDEIPQGQDASEEREPSPDPDPEPGDDAGEPPGEHDAPSEPDEVAQPRPLQRGRQAPLGRPRASDRFQELANRNRDLQERLDRIERASQQPSAEQQRAQAEQLRQQEEQFFLTATPQDDYRYIQQKTQQQADRQIQETRYQLWDTNDKQSFDRTLDERAELRRFGDQVETLRRQYPTVSRLDLLKHAIGDAMFSNIKPARVRQQNRADQAAARHTTRSPAASRGNVGGERQRAGGRRNDFSHMRDVLI